MSRNNGAMPGSATRLGETSVKAELTEFTRQALAHNVPRNDIAAALLQAGWSDNEAAAALAGFADIDFPVPVPQRQPYVSPREAFIYAVQFFALAVSTFSLGSLLFNIIDEYFPDPADSTVWMLKDSMRWEISYLAVAAILFLAIYWRTTRAVEIDPVKRGSKVRRGLTYFTLFVVAVSLAGDAIGLLYHALSGELTIRLVLKVMTVAGIACGTCGFFLSDVRTDEAEA
jgi:hypothetical protein